WPAGWFVGCGCGSSGRAGPHALHERRLVRSRLGPRVLGVPEREAAAVGAMEAGFSLEWEGASAPALARVSARRESDRVQILVAVAPARSELAPEALASGRGVGPPVALRGAAPPRAATSLGLAGRTPSGSRRLCRVPSRFARPRRLAGLRAPVSAQQSPVFRFPSTPPRTLRTRRFPGRSPRRRRGRGGCRGCPLPPARSPRVPARIPRRIGGNSYRPTRRNSHS